MTELELLQMKNNDGLTLKNHQPINYASGFQVATEGKETRNAKTAITYINEYKGDCGIWKSEGVYYIDKSHHEASKQQALAVGRANKQQSIYDWQHKDLIWC